MPLDPANPGGYPEEMTLPSWAADAARKLMDTENLVLLEASRVRYDKHGGVHSDPVLCVAKLSNVEVAERMELQIIAVIADAGMMEDIVVDGDCAIYQMPEIERTDSGG